MSVGRPDQSVPTSAEAPTGTEAAVTASGATQAARRPAPARAPGANDRGARTASTSTERPTAQTPRSTAPTQRSGGAPSPTSTAPALAPTTPKPVATAPTERSGDRAPSKQSVGRRSLLGRKQRFEARKVHRIIRHIDPWSVLKLSVVFFLAVWVMFMVAIVIVWSIAESSGTIGKIEDLLVELDITNTGFDGTFIFRQYGLFGLVMAMACTVATTVGAVVFNLVSDLIGGIWITVIEEETARPADD